MEKLQKERVCACALGRIFGFEPRYIVKFIEALGSAEAVFDLTRDELDGLLGPGSRYSGRIGRKALDESAEELERLAGRGWTFVACTEEAFPRELRSCEDSPAGLYTLGVSRPEDIFNRRPGIAVVGTRDVSPYGREWTARIVEAISQAPSKPVIVSGLAFGVDICAHLAALDSGIPTIAVLPTGPDRIYPVSHTAAAERIRHSEGCALVSDYPPGTCPAANTFLRRNRIIAGLAGATVLTESKIRGGGLITCRLAAGYGREVFVLPGRIDDLRSQGCNLLLREKTAEPITDIRLLGEQLGLGSYNLRRKADLTEKVRSFYSSAGNPRTEELCAMAELVRLKRGADVEELAGACGKSYSEAAGLLGTLESDRFIDMDLLQRCTINIKNV